jgi:hypothetical protein
MKRTRSSVVTQAKAGTLSYLRNPATDEEGTGASTHPAFRRNTGRHGFKDAERTWETLALGWSWHPVEAYKVEIRNGVDGREGVG